MWAVIKYNNNQYNFFKENFRKICSDQVEFYNPKISYKKKNHLTTKYILKNYAFIYCSKFKNQKELIKYKYIKGLKFFLEGYIENQEQIQEFINLCKHHEDKKFNISKSFFLALKMNKIKFLNGPLKNLIFDIFEKNKDKKNFKIKLGQIPLTIQKKSSYYFLPI